jgi:hypothetical protein
MQDVFVAVMLLRMLTIFPPFCSITQIRLLFNQKQTLWSVLNTKSVIKLLEENRKTVQALKSDVLLKQLHGRR